MKKPCTLKAKMYRIPEFTPEFNQLDMVFGGSLKADNRWVVLAGIIPWKEVTETAYLLRCRFGQGQYTPLRHRTSDRPSRKGFCN